MEARWQQMNLRTKLFFGILILILLTTIGINLAKKKGDTLPPNEVPAAKLEETTQEISITKKNITEENFSGSIPVITGNGVLANATRAYIDTALSDFRKSANKEVPAMREQFGADSPTANYTFDMDATYIEGPTYASIVLSGFVYTGGANGNSFYKVFTASLSGDRVLALQDVIKVERQADFAGLVKSELLAWRPPESNGSVVFEDVVDDLTFDSFHDWSLDSKNLTLYFDKYEIGPGVLGSVAFPLPFTKVKDYVK